MTEDEAREIAKQLPAEIHFRGGPYCGYYLHPQTECVHSVYTDQSGRPEQYTPFNFHPESATSLIVIGPLGQCRYERDADMRFSFRGFVQPVEE